MFNKLKEQFKSKPQLYAALFTFGFLLAGSFLYYLGLEFIILLTPLIVGCILAAIIFFWEETPRKKIITISTVAISGFIIEAIGVNTGLLFGDYSYGNLLGWKIFGTPIFVGLLWFLVSYSAFIIVKELNNSTWMSLSLGVILILSFDLILEQFAVLYKFWFWPGNQVPLSNYLTWAVVGLGYLIFYELYLKKSSGRFQLYAAAVLPILSIWLYLMVFIKSF